MDEMVQSMSTNLKVQRVYIFLLANLYNSCENLCVGELRVPKDRTSRLYRFYHLLAVVAGQSEPRGVAVNLHRSPQRLLRTFRHAK